MKYEKKLEGQFYILVKIVFFFFLRSRQNSFLNHVFCILK